MSPLPHEPGPHWGEVGIHGLHRPRRWDAVAVADAPPLTGDAAVFVVLPDGSILVEESEAGFDATELASAVALAPPYRVEAIRRNEREWAVGARRIDVAELGLGGDSAEVAWDGSERSVRIDGEPTLATVPELEALAAARFETWVLRARRLRDRWWEVELEPL